jgi:hypothetical protein
VRYGHGIEFSSFGFTAQGDIELSDGFHVSGYGLSNLHHGLFIMVCLLVFD